MRQKKRAKGRWKAGAFALGAMLLLAGCNSPMVMIAPDVKPTAQKIGPAEGKAAGTLLSPGGGTAYYFVPIMLNDRVQRAYNNALASQPGANALINVTFQENWYWWVLGTSRHVTITGEAVK